MGKKVKMITNAEQCYLVFFRVFDQYEIDIEITKHRHSYLNSGIIFFVG